VIFLIEYYRAAGKIVSLTRFHDRERAAAEKARLDLELRLLGEPVDHEVVVLEAESEDALRKTHRRYIEDLASLATVERP